MSRLVVLAATGLLMLAGWAAGEEAATRPAKIDVAAVVERLASGDGWGQFKAMRELVAAFEAQGEEIEAAANQEGLDPKVAAELKRVVAMQKRRAAAWARSQRIIKEDAHGNQSSALAAYEKVGKRNPTWDDAARECIRHFTYTPEGREAQEKRVAALTAAREVVKKTGCDDPLIKYFLVREKESAAGADMVEVEAELRAAAEALEASGYPARRKCWAHVRYAYLIIKHRLHEKVQVSKDEVEGHLDRAIGQWAEMVASEGMADSAASELVGMIEECWIRLKSPGAVPGDRAALCEKLFPAWERAMPKAVGPWLYKGMTYASYAWDARGTGFANTVTDNGWKLMAERLEIARASLENAYAQDPSDPRPPTEMLKVELGARSDRQAMEKWWGRAMEANPDNYDACGKKLYYLEPKWHGSAEEMIRFGRECLREGNWEGTIPFVLVDAHDSLSKYARSRDEYYAHPVVWEDIRGVYEPFLTYFPEAKWQRSCFAYYATRCGKWEEATRQFDLLEGSGELGHFGSKEAYEAARRETAEKAAAAAASRANKAAEGKL